MRRLFGFPPVVSPRRERGNSSARGLYQAVRALSDVSQSLIRRVVGDLHARALALAPLLHQLAQPLETFVIKPSPFLLFPLIFAAVPNSRACATAEAQTRRPAAIGCSSLQLCCSGRHDPTSGHLCSKPRGLSTSACERAQTRPGRERIWPVCCQPTEFGRREDSSICASSRFVTFSVHGNLQRKRRPLRPPGVDDKAECLREKSLGLLPPAWRVHLEQQPFFVVGQRGEAFAFREAARATHQRGRISVVAAARLRDPAHARSCLERH